MQLEPNKPPSNPLHLKAMTVVFVGIVVMQIANVLACRSETLSVFKMGFWGNRLISGEFFLNCSLHLFSYMFRLSSIIFNTIGIGWKEWGYSFLYDRTLFPGGIKKDDPGQITRPEISVAIFEDIPRSCIYNPVDVSRRPAIWYTPLERLSSLSSPVPDLDPPDAKDGRHR